MATASDDFNRANSGTLGSNWSIQVSGMQIVSNQAEPVNSGTAQAVNWNPSTNDFTDDQYSQVLVRTGASGPGYVSYAVARMTADGANWDGYAIMWGTGLGTIIRMVEITNGSFNTLQDSLGTPAVGDTMYVEAVGTTIKVKQNGAQVGTNQTDATVTTGQPGIGGQYASYDVMDNWEGGDVGGGGGGRIFVLAGVGGGLAGPSRGLAG